MREDRLRLKVVPFGTVAGVTLERLDAALRERLPLDVSLGDPLELPGPRGGHFASGDLLDLLVDRQDATGTGWTLGVAEAELDAPERPFVFGEAEVTGRCAVIGIEPLRRGVGSEVAVRRVVAEAVHELGHVAGLPHCPDPKCAMYPSSVVEDTDRKGTDYCACCADALSNLLGRPAT